MGSEKIESATIDNSFNKLCSEIEMTNFYMAKIPQGKTQAYSKMEGKMFATLITSKGPIYKEHLQINKNHKNKNKKRTEMSTES